MGLRPTYAPLQPLADLKKTKTLLQLPPVKSGCCLVVIRDWAGPSPSSLHPKNLPLVCLFVIKYMFTPPNPRRAFSGHCSVVRIKPTSGPSSLHVVGTWRPLNHVPVMGYVLNKWKVIPRQAHNCCVCWKSPVLIMRSNQVCSWPSGCVAPHLHTHTPRPVLNTHMQTQKRCEACKLTPGMWVWWEGPLWPWALQLVVSSSGSCSLQPT